VGSSFTVAFLFSRAIDEIIKNSTVHCILTMKPLKSYLLNFLSTLSKFPHNRDLKRSKVYPKTGHENP
jgi:hypothetical protein